MTGEALRKLRKRRKWSQEKLADALGVASNTVSRWELGERAISEPMARLIKMVCGDRGGR